MAPPATSSLKKVRLAALERRENPAAAASSSAPFSSSKTPSSKLSKSQTAERKQSNQKRPFAASSGLPDDGTSYAPLPQSILEGEVGTHLQLAKAGAKEAVSTTLNEMWGNNIKALQDAEKAQKQVMLLDNPTTHQMHAEKARAKAQQNSKRSLKHLSLVRHRRLGSFDLDAKYHRYDLYLPLHEMWKDYINSLIAGCNDSMIQSRLLTAELHGAPLEVVDSKNRSFLGTKGLMIRETESTFGIITLCNKFKVIPKEGCIFLMRLESTVVTLFGNNLSMRTLQSGKKHSAKKLKSTIEL